jgi:hypothetical protein
MSFTGFNMFKFFGTGKLPGSVVWPLIAITLIQLFIFFTKILDLFEYRNIILDS